MSFPSGGFSWADKICQRPSRYVDDFREQFQKMCTEFDGWLKPDKEECVGSGSVSPISSAFSNEMSELSSNVLDLELMVDEEDPKKPAVDLIPETSDVVAQHDQEPSGYVDAIREQFQKKFTEVDDWLKPISDEIIQLPASFLAKVHEISEPTSEAIESMINESESSRKNLVALVTSEMGILLEHINTGISSEVGGCNLPVEEPAPQHICVKELGSYASSPLKQEVACQVQEGSKIDQDGHPLNFKLPDNEMQLEENNLTAHVPLETSIPSTRNQNDLMVNIPLEVNTPSMQKHNDFSSKDEGGECTHAFEIPQKSMEGAFDNFSQNSIHGFAEHETSAMVHAPPPKVDQGEHLPDIKVDDDEIELKSKLLIADLTPNMPNTCIPSEKSYIYLSSRDHKYSLSISQHVCIKEASETSLGDSISNPLDSNGKIPAPLAEAACGSFGDNYDANEKERDVYVSPSASEDGCSDKLEMEKNDESIGTILIRLDKFEDVELGDFWDDLDHEEVAILSQRHKANLSYKKKIKNTLKSIPWPSKKKIPNCIANPRSKASVGEDLFSSDHQIKNSHLPVHDSYESDWEVL